MRPKTKFFPLLYLCPHPFHSFLASFFLSFSFIITMLPPLLVHLYLLTSFLDLFYLFLVLCNQHVASLSLFFHLYLFTSFLPCLFFLFLVLCSHHVTSTRISSFISPLSMKVHPLHLFMMLMFFPTTSKLLQVLQKKRKKRAPLLTSKSK
jgi:hypothetical protein